MGYGYGYGYGYGRRGAIGPSRITVQPGVASLQWEGYAPAIVGGTKIVSPGVGELTWQGFAPSLRRTVTPGVGEATWTGYAPTVNGLTAALSLLFSTMSSQADLTAEGVTYSGTSLATMYDSTGKPTYKPNNLLLNTATLSTQNVTSSAINYILSFKGTGTVTLSGTSTAGPLAGTGVADRVALKITPTAGTLTLTVSGSVTDAQLEAVTYETSPRPYVATTAAAHYGPRFDYDPVTLAAKGLLVEEARTNLVTYSEQFDHANYTKAKASVTANAETAPDGTVTADKLAIDGTSGLHQVFQIGKTITSGAAHTASVFLKAGELTWAIVNIYDAVATNKRCWFNLSTGAVGTTEAGCAASIEPVGNGWYRCIVTRTSESTSGGSSFELAPSDGVSSFIGTSGNGIYAWGAQYEAGSSAGTYIPTGASSVSRVADVVKFTPSAGVDTIRYTYEDDATADVSVTPEVEYTIPTGALAIKSIVSV